MGFRPGQIMFLVLGEAMLIGGVSGMISVGLTFVAVDEVLSRFNEFALFVPTGALWWGPAVGAATAFAGSVVPAWSACKIRVTEVFARVG
jgi:ABC-type antimicrobial peptide transport system permease subunit